MEFPHVCSSTTRTDPSDLTEEEATKLGIDQAKELNKEEIFVSDPNLHVGANIVLGENESEFGPMSLEYWKARALNAEEKVSTTNEELEKEKTVVKKLREELATCGDAKQRFSAQADLASTRLNEYKAATAEPIIEAIKPELSCLAPIKNSLKELQEKLNALGEGPALMRSVHNELISLANIIKDNNNSQEASRTTDTESIICLINRLIKALNHFGISPSSPSLDLPKALADLGRNGWNHDLHDAGPTASDYATGFPTSAPQLPYPVHETFLLDPANNITPQGPPHQHPPRFYLPPPTLGRSTAWNSAPAKRSNYDPQDYHSKKRR